jgi:Uma2 family endonuclease
MAISRHSGASAVGRRMTVEEFLALPEEKPYLELRGGVVTQKMAPQGQHGAMESGLSGAVDGFGRPRRLARAFCEIHGTYGSDVLVPDVVIYRWDRIPRLPNGDVADRFPGPPDVAIEIRSPDQSIADLLDKCRQYLANGVPTVLLIHPSQRWVRRFGADGSDVTLRGDDRIDLDDVLPGFDLTVRTLFDTLRD